MCGMHSIPAGVHVCGTYTGMITLLLIKYNFQLWESEILRDSRCGLVDPRETLYSPLKDTCATYYYYP